MDRWTGRVALVTGASVGIGAIIAKELVRFGMKVVGCARNVDKIQALAVECQTAGYSGVLIPYKCDLTSVEDIQSMFAAIKAKHKGVDVCINNAGVAHPEHLLSGKTSGWKNMLDVNVLALSICSREAYQSMKERKIDDGHIMNLNSGIYQYFFVNVGPSNIFFCFSIGGHNVINNSDVHFYTVTKYAVSALTEGLRQELREAKTHIRATSISPGMVETEFIYRLYSDNPEKAKAAYSRFKTLEAIDVANAVVYVLSAPPHVEIGELLFRPVEMQI
ncbi:dehydrogenase/reductase SDR family member 11-like isoform X1 [Girardinichthys multiradiatus]|uniref:dehydrogenase/reductase SDR family member 11-like isoform X1 n=1 Tax=Girardinichthys multiradiatus TaxID=208333 RepID=UPI001FAD62BF|nr:dehydrogenase/reductase SDR family member 11-like isoform X1 [Girardinichthys multiradiatus]